MKQTLALVLLTIIVYLLFAAHRDRIGAQQKLERAEIMAEQKKREDAADYMRRKTQESINQTRLIEAARRAQ